jgi:hypothetical protein
MVRTRTLPLVLTLAVCAAGASARAADDPAPAAPPAAAAADPKEEHEALLGAFRKAQSAWFAEQRKAAEEAQKAAEEAKARGEAPKPVAAMPMVSPVAGEFVARFAEFASRHPGAPEAVDALVFVVQNGAGLADASAAKAALAKLLADHVDSPAIQGILLGLDRYAAIAGDPKAVREDVLARSRNAEVKAAALYGQVMRTFSLGGTATDEEKKAGRTVLERVAKEYPESRWGRRAAGTLHELDRLQVGMVAPDFAGKDAEGRTLRLSDFRGKVVLLDFWGFW